MIAENDAEIMRFSQPLSNTQIKYAELFGANAIRCDRMSEEYVLNNKLIEGLQDSIQQIMHSFWAWKKHATVHLVATLDIP